MKQIEIVKVVDHRVNTTRKQLMMEGKCMIEYSTDGHLESLTRWDALDSVFYQYVLRSPGDTIVDFYCDGKQYGTMGVEHFQFWFARLEWLEDWVA
jgi:hypothetical protein